jgi:hypothetical protein
MLIVGSGMAGLLAAGMIRDQSVKVIEAARSLPNNHSAVLRFKSTAVADALGIEFKAVKMMKCVESYGNPVANAMAYSRKCTGTSTMRSILSTGSELHTRYIAPPDLIQQMAERVPNISFGEKFGVHTLASVMSAISTMPMPALMDILGYEKPNFQFVHGANLVCSLQNVDAYVSVYVPDPDVPFNRISITGNQMIVEFSKPNMSENEIEKDLERLRTNFVAVENVLWKACRMVGINEVDILNYEWKLQRYSKILPIDERERRNFIMWASQCYGIYSLGRFATWRPGLLMDDVVHDVQVIRRIIKNGLYDHRKK